MSTRPKFDPTQVTSLLNRGTAEARGVGRPLVSISPSQPPSLPELAEAAKPQVEVAPAVAETPSLAPELGPAVGDKKAITIRLSDEVLMALYRHQADVRCKPGARLKETTIGAVIDTLLRGPLGLGPHPRQ